MRSLKCLLVVLLLPSFSFAWNGVGHGTGGAIAYYYLKANSPATITKVLSILKDHPWYNNPIWTDQLAGLTGEKRDVSLFMLASTFPDDARDSSYGKSPMTSWHFVDYPFVPAGQSVKGPAPTSPNAEEKINELLKKIGTEQSGPQRAIDLCWIFHLIEDIHEPLHAACLYTNAQPRGDRGGNLTFFKTANSSRPIKLHSYWDGLVKGSFNTIPANAQRLLSEPMYKEAALTELKADPAVHDWIVKESFEIARETAYLNGALTGTAQSPSTVPADYEANATKIGERRVVLSGIRIGKQLTVALK